MQGDLRGARWEGFPRGWWRGRSGTLRSRGSRQVDWRRAPWAPTLGRLGLVAIARAVFTFGWLSFCSGCSRPASGPPTPAEDSAYTNQARAAFVIMGECDASAQQASDVLGRNDADMRYGAVISAELDCRKTANTLENLRFDKKVGQQFQEPLNKSVETCWSAYDAKARRLAKVADTITGDGSSKRRRSSNMPIFLPCTETPAVERAWRTSKSRNAGDERSYEPSAVRGRRSDHGRCFCAHARRGHGPGRFAAATRTV